MLIAEYTYVTTSEVCRIERRKRLNPTGRKARSGTSVVSGARVPARYLHEEFRNTIITPGLFELPNVSSLFLEAILCTVAR